MDDMNAEMEKSGKLLEDEVMGGQESMENDQPVEKDMVGEQQESPGIMNEDDNQNTNEIGVEKEKPEFTGNADVEMHDDQNEQGLLVDEIHDHEKDAKATDDDNTHNDQKDVMAVVDDNGKVTADMDDDITCDNGKDATAVNGDNSGDNEKIATAADDDNTHDNDKGFAAMDDDSTHDNEKSTTAVDDDNTPSVEKGATALDDEMKHDNEKDATAATAVGGENAHDNDKGSAAQDDDNRMQGKADCDEKIKEDGKEADDTGHVKHDELAAPANPLLTHSAVKAKDRSTEMPKKEPEDTKVNEGYESGSEEEQKAFMRELETFCKEKSLEFKPLKFYGQPLNYLKLWRSVIKLGGYDHVTGSKLWRQIGESFNPPKTCTTVSWTFRIFYEKALLEYERHKVLSGELELPLAAAHPEVSAVDNEANSNQTPGSGSGRTRRDAAARAMQGWHTQRLSGYGEVSEPIIKDKNPHNSQKREKSLRSIGSAKQKRPTEPEHPVKAARTEISKQVVTRVSDMGPPADWVKVNVRETKDSYEVFALVPGLLREEVRVQSDPAGRLVITGQPEQLDNPWGITPFKKVIILPSRIDPLRTSAIVSLHGQLYVTVPFERANS